MNHKAAFTIALAALLLVLGFIPAIAEEGKPERQILFTNVNVFDGKTDGLAREMNVLVEGNLIEKVSKSAISAAPAASAPACKNDCGTLVLTGARSPSPASACAPLAAQTVRSVAGHSDLGPVRPNGVIASG